MMTKPLEEIEGLCIVAHKNLWIISAISEKTKMASLMKGCLDSTVLLC
jgi:hypothetical protein